MSDFGPKQLLEGHLPLHVLQYVTCKFYSNSFALQILNIPYSFTSVYIYVPLLKPTHILVHLSKPPPKKTFPFPKTFPRLSPTSEYSQVVWYVRYDVIPRLEPVQC